MRKRPLVRRVSIENVYTKKYVFGRCPFSFHGNWYTGKHEPLVTKELFDLVQEQTHSQSVKADSKEFAFTRLMTCGLCGSGISACEKFKKQKNGNVHCYVYYGCTKSRDKNCTCGYLEEKELIKQFESLIDKIDLDENGIGKKIKDDIERLNKFQGALLGQKVKVKTQNINIRNYTKFILEEGTNSEKRELLSNLKSKIHIRNKAVSLIG